MRSLDRPILEKTVYQMSQFTWVYIVPYLRYYALKFSDLVLRSFSQKSIGHVTSFFGFVTHF